MSDDKKDIIITEPVPTAEATQDTMTKEQALDKGWSKEEIEKAEKRGMIKEKPEEKPKEEKPPEAKPEEKPEEKPEDKKPDEKKGDEVKPKPTRKDYQLEPDKEAKFIETFGPGTNVTGLYLGLKGQRARAQSLEMERDNLIIENKVKETKLKEMEERVSKLESGRNGSDDGIGDEGVDPDDKPVTVKQLKTFFQSQAEEKKITDEAVQKKADAQYAALKSQEEAAKLQYPDYEKVVAKGEILFKNLDKLEGLNRKKAIKLMRELRAAAGRADKLTDDDYNATDISYEIGQFAESLQLEKEDGIPADKSNNGHEADRNPGNLTPDKLKRIEDNTKRRQSSASLSGVGGHRIVSPEDVTLEDAHRMTPEQRMEFKRQHPAKWKALINA